LEGSVAPSEPASHNGGGVVRKGFRKFWRMEGFEKLNELGWEH